VRFEADLEAITRPATALLMEAAAPRLGESVLDVGCGAGGSSFAIAKAVGPEGSVLGVDVSAPLLARAEAERRSRGVGNVAFEQADAQTRRFETGAFDLVVSRFGVMFFDDPAAALANLGAGLRPGGRVAFVAWAGIELNPWFALPARAATEALGPVEAGDPDAPGPMAFRDVGRVTGLLRAAGFEAVEGEVRRVELVHPGGAAALARLGVNVGPAARILREKAASEADRAAVEAALVGTFAGFDGAGGAAVPAALTVYRARRP
jgi:SAM-dependent methyltransferase